MRLDVIMIGSLWNYASRQRCCRCSCQISGRMEMSNPESRGFETSRDLAVWRPSAYQWKGLNNELFDISGWWPSFSPLDAIQFSSPMTLVVCIVYFLFCFGLCPGEVGECSVSCAGFELPGILSFGDATGIMLTNSVHNTGRIHACTTS